MTTTGDDKKIKTAVGFLNNPKVIPAPEDKKREFLKKKGLTDDEITQAFKLAKEELEKKKAAESAPKETTSEAPKDEGPQMTVEESIEKAKQSNSLFLKKANIKTIPPAVFELQNLQTLVINGSTLDTISPNIAKLTNLKTLHLVGCNLFDNQLPKELWSLPNLEEINFSKNKLANIGHIVNLQNLRVADLSENQILAVPTDISKLSKLETLNLRNNNISTIPSTIANVPNLKQFYVKGNNLEPKLEEAARKGGLKGLIQYLSEDY